MVNSNPFNIQIFFYKIFGLWQYDDEPFYGSIFYKVYGVILHLLFTFLYITLTCLNVFYISSLDDLTKCLYITLTEIAFLSKMLNFLKKRYEIRKIVFTQLHNDVNEVIQMDDEYVVNRLKFNWYINAFYLGVSWATCVAAYCKPIFDEDRMLPFPSYYPLDWKHNLTYYIIICLYQGSMLIHSSLNVTCDTVLSTAMNCVAILYHTLGGNIESLGMDHHGLDNKRKFRGYIIRHEELWSYTKSLENVYSVVIFIQFCMSVLVLCVTAFQISIMSPMKNPSNFMLYIFYILAMIAQFFLPCFFGNEIISKSSDLMHKIYFSNWIKYLPDKSYRQMIIIFMERLKKPTKMTAGRLFSLSLQTFTSIINSAYSFYALLQNMQKG